jgi:hypothetical protein
MVLNTGISVMRKLRIKNLQIIPFGEGQVQDPIPALAGHRSKISAVLLGDTYSSAYFKMFNSWCRNGEKIRHRRTDRRTDRGTISIELEKLEN